MSKACTAASERGEFDAHVQRKRVARMDHIDGLPADLRALVHEYGWQVVDNYLRLGVTKPRHIRHLVETVLDEFSPTRGSFSKQGVRTQHVAGTDL